MQKEALLSQAKSIVDTETVEFAVKFMQETYDSMSDPEYVSRADPRVYRNGG